MCMVTAPSQPCCPLRQQGPSQPLCLSLQPPTVVLPDCTSRRWQQMSDATMLLRLWCWGSRQAARSPSPAALDTSHEHQVWCRHDLVNRLGGYAQKLASTRCSHVIKVLVSGGVQYVEAVQLLLPGRRSRGQGCPQTRIEGLRHSQIGVILQGSVDMSAWTPASCHAASNG